MASILESLSQGAPVAVIRLRSLGDCVLTTPALAILKRARPDLRLAVAVEPRFAAVFESNPDVDAILPPEVRAVRRFRPELCLNLHGGGSSARLTALSGARYRAGFAHFRYSWLYNVSLPRAQQVLGVERKVHTAEHLASAVFHLGAPGVEIGPARLYADPSHKTPAAPYTVIHPFASQPDKTWPASRFLEIARHVPNPVFIGAPGDDLARFHAVSLALEELKSLLSAAALFIGNDSGPAHMAAAFAVPVVVLFGTSDPVVWAPWRTQGEVFIGNPITAITVEHVLARLPVCMKGCA